MQRILLDTSIIIDYLRQSDSASTHLKKIFSLKDVQFLIPGIVVAEIYAGKSSKQRNQNQRIGKILNQLTIVLPKVTTFKKAGTLFRDYSPTVLSDALVAATALEQGAILATLDQKHYQSIPKLKFFSL